MSRTYNFRASTVAARVERQKKTIKTSKKSNMTIEIIPKVEEFQIVKLTDEDIIHFSTGLSINKEEFVKLFSNMVHNTEKCKNTNNCISQFIEIWKLLSTNAGLDMMKTDTRLKNAVTRKTFEVLPIIVNMVSDDAKTLVSLMNTLGFKMYDNSTSS